MIQHWFTASYTSPGCGDLHTHNHDSAMYGNTTKHTAQWAILLQTSSLPLLSGLKYGFRLALRTTLSVLSGCNRPHREVRVDNRQVYVCVMGLCSCGPAILYWGIQKRRLAVKTTSGLCSAGAVIHSQTHWAKPSNANSLSHNRPIEAWGSCRWTHRVTLSIALPLHCSGLYCNGKSLYKQQHTAGRFHFL